MAEFSMWGPEKSPVAIDQQQRLNEITMQDKQAQTEERRAQAENFRANAQKQKFQVEQKQKFQTAIQTLAAEGKASSQEDLVHGLYNMGFPMEAAKQEEVLEKTLEFKAKKEHELVKTTSEKLKQQGMAIDQLAKNAGIIRTSPNPQAAWEMLKDHLAKSNALPPELKNAPYSPQLMDQLEAASVSKKDKLEADRKRLKDDGEERLHKSQERLNAAREDLDRAKIKTESARQERLRKLGEGTTTKPVGRTPREDVKTMANLIKDKYPDVEVDSKGELVDPAASATASALAAEANKLVRDNKGLDRGQALAQVFQSHQNDGTFKTFEEPKKLLGFEIPTSIREGTKKVKITPPGTGARDDEEDDDSSNEALDKGKVSGQSGRRAEARPSPTKEDRAYAKAHPEVAERFKKHFGVAP